MLAAEVDPLRTTLLFPAPLTLPNPTDTPGRVPPQIPTMYSVYLPDIKRIKVRPVIIL